MANIRQYIAWAEKRIGRLIIAESLHCGLLGVVQGPLVITFKVRLLHPSPAALRRLLGLGPALAQALQVSAVRIAEQPGYIAIELPSPIQRTPGAADLAQHTRGLSVAVGYNTLRQPVAVDLRQHGALFWVGPSRRGKTQSMKASLYALARRNGSRLKYMVLSQKRHDWAAFETACGCMGIVSQAAEALQALTWAAETVRSGGWPGLHLVVVCDDLLNLLSAEPDIADPLAEIASMGAGLGVHLLAGTQEAGSKRGTGGAAVENNATAKILYRLTSAAAGARAAGQADAGIEALSGAKGDALLLLDGQGERIATGWADDGEILQLTQRPAGALVAPWLSTTSRQPPTTGLQPVTTGYNQLQPPATMPHDTAHVGAAMRGDPQPVVAVATGCSFPIPKREPTAEEANAIRALYGKLGSMNATCKRAYGFKDGQTYAWVKRAVEGPAPEIEPAPEGEPAHLDMNTPEGAAAVRLLIDSGILPKDTVTQSIGQRAKVKL